MPQIRAGVSTDITPGNLRRISSLAGLRYTGDRVGGPTWEEAMTKPDFVETVRKSLLANTDYPVPDSATFQRDFGRGQNAAAEIPGDKPHVRIEFLGNQAKDLGGGLLEMLKQSLPDALQRAIKPKPDRIRSTGGVQG